MSHRRARSTSARRARAVAAAVSFASIGGFGASIASAQLVYEPFNYAAGTSLDGKVNPGNAQPWSAISADPGDDEIVVNASSLAYSTSFAGSVGGSVSYAGTGKSERLSLGPVIASGTEYYSLVLNVASVGGMTTTPVFVAGFSNRSGPSDFFPTAVGTRLYLKQSTHSTPQTPMFVVGVSIATWQATNAIET